MKNVTKSCNSFCNPSSNMLRWVASSSFSNVGIDHAKRSPLLQSKYYVSSVNICVWSILLNFFSLVSRKVWDISQLIFSLHISAQLTCDGTETFEKISGVNISSARLTPLYSEAGGTVTAQCNNRYEITCIKRKFFIFLTTFPLLYNLCQVGFQLNYWHGSSSEQRNAFREDGNMRIITKLDLIRINCLLSREPRIKFNFHGKLYQRKWRKNKISVGNNSHLAPRQCLDPAAPMSFVLTPD